MKHKKTLTWIVIVVLALVIGVTLDFYDAHRACGHHLFNLFNIRDGFCLDQSDIPATGIPKLHILSGEYVDWQEFDNLPHHYTIYYPDSFSFGTQSTTDTTIFTYSDEGDHSLIISTELATQPLLDHVKAVVEASQKAAVGSAAPVSVTYATSTIGTTNGYVIISAAGDVPRNTSKSFILQDGNEFITLSYSYQAYIFMDPHTVVGGGPVSQDLLDSIKKKQATNQLIEKMLKSFKTTTN